MKVIGADGCKAGWFLVILWSDGRRTTEVQLDARSLWETHADTALILADIPIGLSACGVVAYINGVVRQESPVTTRAGAKSAQTPSLTGERARHGSSRDLACAPSNGFKTLLPNQKARAAPGTDRCR